MSFLGDGGHESSCLKEAFVIKKKDEVNLPQICGKYGNMSHSFISIFCKPNVCLTEPKHLAFECETWLHVTIRTSVSSVPL